MARFEPELHKRHAPLTIKNWWWEDDVHVSEELKQAIKEALDRFCNYLGADGVDKSVYQILESQ